MIDITKLAEIVERTFENQTIIRVVRVGPFAVVSLCNDNGTLPLQMPNAIDEDGNILPYDMRNEGLRKFYDSGEVIYEDPTIIASARNNDGGPGSGNFGHKGVEGQIGGSAPSEGTTSPKKKSELKQNRYTQGERRALESQKGSASYLMSKTGMSFDEAFELYEKGEATARAQELIDSQYEQLTARYERCSQGQKKLMDMSPSEINSMLEASGVGNPALNPSSPVQACVSEFGLDDKPSVVGKEDFERVAAESESGTIYRGVVGNDGAGVTADQIVDITINGDETYIGSGVHCDGIYFSTAKDTADHYAKNGNGRVMTACVDSSARVIDYEDLMTLRGESDIRDAGVCALYHGYNVVKTKAKEGEDYYIALDRSSLVFLDDRTDAKDDLPEDLNGEELGKTFNGMVCDESIFSNIFENPIDKSAFTDIIKSKESTNEDYGVPGMKWGEHKAEEEEAPKSPRTNPNVDVMKEITARGIDTKTVKQKHQKKHFKGPDYVEGKSYFTIKPEEIEEIVQANIGKGYGLTNHKGEWTGKENIDCGRIIGYNVKPDGTEEPTQFADIHYSKDGYHLVPTYDKRGK